MSDCESRKRLRVAARAADLRRGLEATRRQEATFSTVAWCSNLDGRRSDRANDEDNPFRQFQYEPRLQQRQEESLRIWAERPAQTPEQPCLLCHGAAFQVREELMTLTKSAEVSECLSAYGAFVSTCRHGFGGIWAAAFVTRSRRTLFL